MRRVFEILQRRQRMFWIPFLIVFVVPVLWSVLFMRSYEANSLVWLDSDVSISAVLSDRAPAEGTRPIQQEADTLQQLLQSRTFLRDVIRRTPLQSKMRTPKERARTIAFLRKNLKAVVVGPNSLKITFYGRSPKEAVVIADATTDQFTAWVTKSVKQQNDKSVGFFTRETETYLDELEKSRSAFQAFKEKHPESQQLDIADKVLSAPTITASPAVQSEFQRLKSRVQYAQELYDSSLADLAKTRAVTTAREEHYVNGLSVIDTPIEPTSFAKKRLLMFDFLAFMAAVMLGATAVVVSELTDRTLHSRNDVETELGVPVLTELRQHSDPARRA